MAADVVGWTGGEGSEGEAELILMLGVVATEARD